MKLAEFIIEYMHRPQPTGYVKDWHFQRYGDFEFEAT